MRDGNIIKARWLRLSAFHPLALPWLHLVVHDELDLVAVAGQDLLGEGVVELFAKGARVVQPPWSCISSFSNVFRGLHVPTKLKKKKNATVNQTTTTQARVEERPAQTGRVLRFSRAREDKVVRRDATRRK